MKSDGWRALYLAGHDDTSIAAFLGVHRVTIGQKRLAAGFPANVRKKRPKLATSDEAARRALYDRGSSDTEIAAQVGVTSAVIYNWRKRYGLPSAHLTKKLDDAHNAARMLLYSLDYSDHRIARDQCVSAVAILKWRRRRGLPPNVPVVTSAYRQRLKAERGRDIVLERVRRAVGRRLSPDVVDDAVSDLYLAVLDGTIPLAEIEANARKYGNRVLDQYANRFGPRSLDEAIGEDDFTLMDTLRDESSSSWLEEMGATVW